MKTGFVKTENFRRLAEAQKLVERRGAREAGLVLVKGPYGIGKSELTERWATDSGWIFVRAKATWTKRAMLDELADLMGVSKTGRNQEVQARIIGKLAVDMVPMIIDEADFLVGSTASLLEVVRDITDITGTMCFLVGMEQFALKVARHGHIASRVEGGRAAAAFARGRQGHGHSQEPGRHRRRRAADHPRAERRPHAPGARRDRQPRSLGRCQPLGAHHARARRTSRALHRIQRQEPGPPRPHAGR
ncbi:AAA family ATPase [Acidovorax citrulli]|nr:AAA family ATPase [Paracidovorax citrulli]